MRKIFYCGLLFLIGFAVYANTLKSPFYFDDIKQVAKNESIRQLKNIPTYYYQTSHILDANNFGAGHFYRPFFYTAYAVIYQIGSGKPFMFHFVQILVFCSNAVLLFLLFIKFFGQKTAFLLAAIFLVHPANEEVGQYIANLQDNLFFFFGMISLLVATKKSSTTFTVALSSFFIFLSLLSKETGALFIFLVILYIFLFRKNQLKKYLLFTGCISFIYGILRFISVANPASNTTSIHLEMAINQRLILIPKIITYYIQTIILPTPVLPNKNYLQNTSYSSTILPILAIFCAIAITIILGLLINKYHKKLLSIYIFMVAWTTLGFAFHSQLIPLDVLVASRWIYFSLAGVLGVLGVLTKILRPQLSKYKFIIIIIYLTYIVSCSAVTIKANIIRNDPIKITAY